MHLIDKYLKKFISKNDYILFQDKLTSANNSLINSTCKGNEMLGWMRLDTDIKKIEQISEKIKSEAEIVFVVGIGGSYTGAKMAIDFLKPFSENKIYFLGNNIDAENTLDIFEKCKDKSVHVVIVSKSGSTLEIRATLAVVIEFMYKKYEDRANKRFTAVTGSTGLLNEIAKKNSWNILKISEDVGGRFSVLTNAGLLPISIAGANIKKIVDGAIQAKYEFMETNNICHRYSTIRNILYSKGFKVELISSFSTRLDGMLAWLKQLFGESEGKENKGIFPSSAMFSSDLHSIGQFIQEGSKILFETILFSENFPKDIKISSNHNDELLRNKSFNEINLKILEGSSLAHYEGGVPCLILKFKEFKEFELGKLIFFFEKSCALSALILGVNPFNQPGVEAYKKNTIKLLG